MTMEKTEELFDSIMAKQDVLNEDSAVESEDDSEYGGDTDADADGPTTFRMLLDKVSVKDSEFIDRCQHGGLIAQNPQCMKCYIPMVLVEDRLVLDGAEWACSSCSYRQSIRLGSWYSSIELCRLKDILLILYCWSRNYSEALCQHELESVEVRAVPLVYNMCHKLSMEYFRDEISSIGSKGSIVEIEEFRTAEGVHIIGGVEKGNTKNVFFRVLPENWTRDELVTAIADNIAPETILNIQNSTLLEILDKEGVEYLKSVWSISVETASDEDSSLVPSLWTLFEKLFLDKTFTECRLLESLFRRRMEAAKDPFLFLLSVINKLHPISYENTSYET